jgi:NDP-sugar pyrophosphorylase family protein
MQAVILAAGMGKRLGELTRHSTKCMVTVNNKRLIEHAFDVLKKVGVRHAVLIVGHGADELKAFLGDEFNGVRVEYSWRARLWNGTIHSFWKATLFSSLPSSKKACAIRRPTSPSSLNSRPGWMGP